MKNYFEIYILFALKRLVINNSNCRGRPRNSIVYSCPDRLSQKLPFKEEKQSEQLKTQFLYIHRSRHEALRKNFKEWS